MKILDVRKFAEELEENIERFNKELEYLKQLKIILECGNFEDGDKKGKLYTLWTKNIIVREFSIHLSNNKIKLTFYDIEDNTADISVEGETLLACIVEAAVKTPALWFKEEVLPNKKDAVSTEAERSLLGCILLDSNLAEKAFLNVPGVAFSALEEMVIYEKMKNLYANKLPINCMSVSEGLSVDCSYIYDLASNLPSTLYFDHYIEKVNSDWVGRQVK